MAIFGFKKRKDEKLEQEAQSAKSSTRDGIREPRTIVKKGLVQAKALPTKISVPMIKEGNASSSASVIIRPRVTEKSGVLSQSGTYTFEVVRSANKNSVSKAFSALYKVKPVKIAMINTPIKNVFVKGRRGSVAGIRKAVITLKKGDKIEFI